MSDLKQERTRIKFCGLTRPEDALAAVTLGVDALGLIFYPGSSRAVSAEQAAAICRQLPPFVTVVGLFVNANAQTVAEICRQVPLNLLQFHGDETPHYCEQFSLPYIRALRVRDQTMVEQGFSDYHRARGLLVDAWDPQQYGGTGHSFNWKLLPGDRPLPLILAGGLSSANVADAIRQVRPWAVDVSGGIEDAPGLKSIERMQTFVSEVRSVN
ncbi:MAG: phosphoribosylanthranilate isomerase [Halomonadaceae bacterium]|nr:MAG: phosphoribosylanthranilate isomerase [Halomonadaceae bacterium]